MLNRIITIYSISYIVGTILFPLLAEALLNASMLAPYVIAMIVLWLAYPVVVIIYMLQKHKTVFINGLLIAVAVLWLMGSLFAIVFSQENWLGGNWG